MSLLEKLNPKRLPPKLKEKANQAAALFVMQGYKAGGGAFVKKEFKKFYKEINKTLNEKIDEKTISQWKHFKKRFSKPVGEPGPIMKEIQAWLPSFYDRIRQKIVLESDKKFIKEKFLPFVKEAEKQQLTIALRQMKLIN